MKPHCINLTKISPEGSGAVCRVFALFLMFFAIECNSVQLVCAQKLRVLPVSECALVNSVQKAPPPAPSSKSVQVRQATLSMIALICENSGNRKEPLHVKVPTYIYASLLQELQQNQKVKFIVPGGEIPAEAKSVFQLEGEGSGLQQTVCFF